MIRKFISTIKLFNFANIRNLTFNQLESQTVYFENRALHILQEGTSLESKWPVVERESFFLQGILEMFEHHRELAVERTSSFCPLAKLSSCMKMVTAAGGAVRSENDKLLLIRRFNKWDLPKGRSEEGEIPSQTALREIREETGVHSLEIIRELHHSYHAYDTYGQWELKHTVWFEMKGREEETLQVQSSEDIEQALWVRREMLDFYMEDAFYLIRDVIGKIVW
ncbi:MAG: NUDIX domain-containing protein [Alistipes sp.]|nr:NUDIX domain-containing protein [Candidatus Alistipes equi]